MSDITFKLTAATNVGLVRTNNEDNFIVNPDLTQNVWDMASSPDHVFSLGENGCLLVVADGMGGMNAGEVASELAVRGVQRAFSEVKDFSSITDSSSHIETFMKKVIVGADKDIKDRVSKDPSTSGMGTTIVMAWIIGNMVHVAWCGDSRAYLFNRITGLSRMSKDHSYVQELVDSGKLDPDLAFDHPNSNIITRSLGDSSAKARPDYICKRLSVGDYILLCSDGLCGLCRDEEILAVLMQDHPTLEEYESDLFTAALEAGGHDNITIALFQCISLKENELAATLAPEKIKQADTANAPGSTQVPRKKKGGSVVLWILLLLLIAAGLTYGAWHMGYIPELPVLGTSPAVKEAVEEAPAPTGVSEARLPQPAAIEEASAPEADPILESTPEEEFSNQ